MIAGYILTGGQNRRMNGAKKLLLTYRGRTFLEWIMDALRLFPKVYLSVDSVEAWRSLLREAVPEKEDIRKREDIRKKEDISRGEGISMTGEFPMVEDLWKGAGPLGGIVSGLTACKEDVLFVTTCDMPFIQPEAVKKLLRQYEKNQTVTVASADGRVQPLFGIYPKLAQPVLKEKLEAGELRVMSALEAFGYQCVEIEKEALRNINSVMDYEAMD